VVQAQPSARPSDHNFIEQAEEELRTRPPFKIVSTAYGPLVKRILQTGGAH
jgi:hypothetical protein